MSANMENITFGNFINSYTDFQQVFMGSWKNEQGQADEIIEQWAHIEASVSLVGSISTPNRCYKCNISLLKP